MAKPITVTKVKGVVGHFKVRHERGAYHINECYAPGKYRKILELTNYEDTLPYRNPEFKNKGKKQKETTNYAAKIKPVKKNADKLPVKKSNPKCKDKEEVKTIPSNKKDKKVFATISNEDRPYAVVQIDRKTQMWVSPDKVDGAIERYYNRIK